ncbi:hypothetical protein AAFF_G00129490 [Aldrovandia affinis]|uniref:ferroxidase n=1 Tax=Aldrovandia affinis TaxID=143900 RepID=A0AAD7T1E7_9TELE|nr:hypothetical protein AAFF_G00129490 [Aldrovandia affinis]
MSWLQDSRVLLICTLCIAFPIVESITRTYYIGIKEESWNYAPSGQNQITGKDIAEDELASVFLLQGPHRIGAVYKKALYRGYTDQTYSIEIPKPECLGFLGPTLRAESGDIIIVHMKNFATRPYSLHPHGIFYEKDSEGALYPDGTSGKQKLDDAVPPGGNHTYTWIVKPEFSPTEGDTNCLTWVYHSHVDAPRDISSGLIGALLTCKKGTLLQMSSNQAMFMRTDVDQEFFLMFTVVDENLSWYMEENIQTFCSDPTGVDPDDEDFQESNLMHAINGYLYGNLPGVEVCLNQTVAWHLFGMGNEVDIHSASFYGHTVLNQGHRTDVLSLFPATFITALMVPVTPGKWMLVCQVNDHIQAGMQAFYQVSYCGKEDNVTEVTPGGKIRQYYIAAEEQLWNYAPLGIDTLNNLSLVDTDRQSEVFFGSLGGRLGGVYKKVRYVAYTNENFTIKREQTAAESHLGILGPVIRAETGDLLLVTFMNKASRNFSLQPHGLQYDKAFEGASYQDGVPNDGALVRPGDSFTYRWRVMEGPSPSDPACISYLYYSASDPVQDTNSGLVGPLLVCKRDVLNENGFQKGMDKEYFLLFSVLDENLSWYLEDNVGMFGTNESELENEDFLESNKMHAVNGLMYGNLQGLDLCVGNRVSWHTMGLGTEVDMHGVYFQGNTFQREGTNRDTLHLFPHTAVTVSMQPDSTGTFDGELQEVSCRTSDHYLGGMRQQYSVTQCEEKDIPQTGTPPIVQYFIAAEELEWDYSPSRAWELQKHNTTEESSLGSIFVGKGENRIGSKYKKVVYREYTDATFKMKKQRVSEEEHLQIMGPIIRAEVGERVLVNFKNKATLPFSIHAHGAKTPTGQLTPVQPGGIKQYQWDFPERSGPGISDTNCISFAYYSPADFVKDTASGLFGPLVVCRKGTLDQSRQRRDVDREFALLFMVFDENESWYLGHNIQTYLNKDPSTFPMSDDFLESNKMHAINGKLYGNLQGLTMVEGQKTDWYLLGMGNEVDLHTVHFHGQTFIYMTDLAHRADVYELFPGTSQTVEMIAENPGRWLLHCHVTDHVYAGMETVFSILSRTDGNNTINAAPTLKSFLFVLGSDDNGSMMLVILIGLGLLLSAEVSVGTQITCFAPTNFSWRQAAYVDSFCWAAVQQQQVLSVSETSHIPLWLHKFFPYILLLELDRSYNRAIKLAKSLATNLDSNDAPAPMGSQSNIFDLAEGCFKYPLVEQYLKTKRGSRSLVIKYLICRVLTLVTLLFACLYLGYYINLASVTDEFTCNIRTGILHNETSIPSALQCKLVAVGVFQLLSYINLVVYALLAPVVIYTALIPVRQSSLFLRPYEALPTFGILDLTTSLYDDLSVYLLFLEENLSELKSYRCLQVLQLLQESGGENLDTMCMLRTLGQVKTDIVDGKTPATVTAEPGEGANSTELKDISTLLLEDGLRKEEKSCNEKAVRQRVI